jgi:hypothetical protein
MQRNEKRGNVMVNLKNSRIFATIYKSSLKLYAPLSACQRPFV